PARRRAAAFPDGQFFCPPHAHPPGQRPVDPADALASLLLAAGLAAQQIPPGLAARAARWRDQVAGKKILLLLDDAAGHEQVRPLLPGTAGSLGLVPSRRRLAAPGDAAGHSLGPGRRGGGGARGGGRGAGRGWGAGEAGGGETPGLGGSLPLAIGMLASQLRHPPAWTASQLATDLAEARDRLELMEAENLSVGAAFDLSYADLTPGRQLLFRRLGLIPGPDFDAYAAAPLQGASVGTPRRALGELYAQHLLTDHAPGRYRLHDLLRQHARALVTADGDTETDAAAGRLLDSYLHTALAA